MPWIDLAAQENVDFSLRKLDKRQGWRGPVARLQRRGGRGVPAQGGRALRQRAPRRRAGCTWAWSSPTTAAGARVRVGTELYFLPSANMTWAFPFSMQGLDQRQDRSRTPAACVRAGRRHLGVQRPPDQPPPLLRLDLRQQERGAAGCRPTRTRQPPGRPALRLEQTPARAGGHLQLRPRHAATWWRWWAAPTSTARSSTG